jgi:Putative transposase
LLSCVFRFGITTCRTDSFAFANTFSVFAGEPLSPQDAGQLECLARYITRPPLAADSIRRRDDGLLQITTPSDPRTGSTVRLLDPLDWIHAVTAHIPDRGRHCVRYYGMFANCARSPRAFSEQQTAPAAGPGAMADTASEFVQRRPASWARLIKKIFGWIIFYVSAAQR